MRKFFYLFIAALALVACGEEPTIDDNGTLKGRFTVDYKGTQVQFSRGNLQYQNCTNTWRFAENQWDFVGGTTTGTVTEAGVSCDNTKIASNAYAGWIDLFGWGTGNAPIKSSKETSDYPTFVDWGTNAISNGGNRANMWRMLTMEEWVYLFCSRANAASLFGLGTVNGINGTIVLPDNWTLPNGASFTPSTTKGLLWQNNASHYYNNNHDNFSHNTYTKEEWAVMEAAGAVFLPAAGIRYDTNINHPGIGGYYWYKTPLDEVRAYHLGFGPELFNQQNFALNYYGMAVRLVR